MLVKTYRDGIARTGLHIGEANARRYFSKSVPCIELRLDDLHIQCTLGPDFWKGSPEIYDPRLSVWLEFKVARRGAGRDPIQLALLPSGSGTFTVRPADGVRPETFGDNVSRPRRVASERAFRPASHPPVARSVA